MKQNSYIGLFLKVTRTEYLFFISILSVTEPFTDEGSITVLADTSRLSDTDYVFSCIKEALEASENVMFF